MKLVSKLIAPALLLAAPFSALAHPGHGHDNPLSPRHYLANPEHAVPLAIVVVALAVVAFMWKSGTSKSAQKE